MTSPSEQHPRILSLTGVSRRYAGVQALAELDLELSSNQTMGLLGPNGAGKTTLLSIAACTLAPSTGAVSVLGTAVRTSSSARRARASIGVLPQQVSWIPSFTGTDMVEYAAWLKDVDRRDRAGGVAAALEKVDMLSDSGRRMSAMSGGMRQRIGVAMALVGRPRLLLLDEPTVGLDPAQRLSFRRMIAGLGDVAVILSTHLVEDIRAAADTVLILEAGRALWQGTTRELETMAGPADDAATTPMERGYMALLESAHGPAARPQGPRR